MLPISRRRMWQQYFDKSRVGIPAQGIGSTPVVPDWIVPEPAKADVAPSAL